MSFVAGIVRALSTPRADAWRQARADDFHAHLDVCRQCAENPFALCQTGARLLEATASEPPKKG